MEYPLTLTVVIAILGALIGSFLNVVILRLPQDGASVVFPASHCPKCKHNLSWFENIPVLSYCCLLGRCRSCKEKISIQYPLVEIAMCLSSLALFLHFGATLTFAGYFIFLAALICIIVIDLHHQIIPDVISLPGIVLGLIFSFVNTEVSSFDSLIGVVAGGGFLYLVAWGYYLVRKQDGMGGGDIKLLGMLGAWLGWQSLLFIIFASSLFGAIIGISILKIQGKENGTRIPFGPFLSLAGIAYLFWAEQIQYCWGLYLTGQLF